MSLPQPQQRQRTGLIQPTQGRGALGQQANPDVIATPQHRIGPAAYTHQNDEFFES